jgi:molecular chaperone IbpA
MKPISAHQFLIGINRAFDELSNQPKYPPHDIIRVTPNIYHVVIAVAGFTRSAIDITVEDSTLKISGTKIRTVGDDEIDYIYNGISHRSFKKEIGLGETIQVIGAKVEDGLLTIELEEIVPAKKSKKIDIR